MQKTLNAHLPPFFNAPLPPFFNAPALSGTPSNLRGGVGYLIDEGLARCLTP